MNCGIKRILQFHDIMTMGPIQVFNMDNINITTSCMFSWSNDLICWTDWTDYATYIRISKNIEEDMYIRILINDSFDRISINGLFTKCYSIWIDSSNPFIETFCGNENLFNPYSGLDCALQLQQQLSDNIICMLGIPVFYFRVAPDEKTIDYTFKEYVLHNVVDLKQVKLMIPDGTMPSSNPKFTALDFDWQVDWDVEMGKTDFTTAFGEGIVPKVRDFIYIPMMKRMWKVNTAYDEKNEGLMWQSTTWKLSLIKYEDSDNISIPETMDDIIDGWLTRYDDVLGKKEQKEQERESAVPQISAPRPTATNLCSIAMSDAIRASYSKNEVSIIDYQYNHHSNVVARNIYKFKTPTAAVVYQKGYCGCDGTLSFILQTQGMPVDNQNIIIIGPINIKISFQQAHNNIPDRYMIECNGMKAYINSFSTQLVILRWNSHNYTVSLNCYEYTHIQDIAPYLLKPEMYYFSDTPTVSEVSEYNQDYNIDSEQDCYITPYPCMITNIKLYNKDLGLDDAIKESIKYTTTHSACVINDVARHISSNHGYAVH